jgi:nucleoside-diphosphate-sugar epimerase
VAGGIRFLLARAADFDPATFTPQFYPARAGEVLRSCLDVTRARTDLALPPPTPLEVGLAATLDWVRTLQARWPRPESVSRSSKLRTRAHTRGP